MIQLTVGERTLNLASTLKVIYALKDIAGAANMKDAIASISTLDLEGQLALLYAAYRAEKSNEGNMLSKEEFTELLLDTYGICALTEAVNVLTDGLLYAGLSEEQAASKKAQMTEALKAGVPSSVRATD